MKHKIISGLIVLAYFTIGCIAGEVKDATLVTVVLGAVSILLIWFPELLGEMTGMVIRGAYINNKSPTWLVRLPEVVKELSAADAWGTTLPILHGKIKEK